MTEENSTQKIGSAIGILLAMIFLVGHKYFDIDTRWKLSGTWECHQDNGARTTEKFQLFGFQTTLNTSGAYSGVQIFSSYSLNGNKIQITSKSLKRADSEIREFDEIQWPRFSLSITKLTDESLSYIAKSSGKISNVDCIRQE